MLSFRNILYPPSSFSPHKRKHCTFYNQACTDLERNCLRTIYYPANETLSQRTNEPRAPSCVLPWNLKECFHRMHVKEGRVSIPQFNSCNPQGPDVTARVIGRVILLLTSDDLPKKSSTQHINPLPPPKGPLANISPLLSSLG